MVCLRDHHTTLLASYIGFRIFYCVDCEHVIVVKGSFSGIREDKEVQ